MSANPTAPPLIGTDFLGWGPRVLVADDDEISRAAGKGLLSALGLATDLAVNGREALEMSARWPYVAIFMDCEMPEVDGYAALTQLHRREGANVHTPVIAVTSRPQWLSLAAGMDHHIGKPLQMDELRATCRRLGMLVSERDDTAAAPGEPAAEVPLLDPAVFGSVTTGERSSKARRAAAYLEQATARLPEMWRAANASDAPTMHRLALALKARADAVGATRISALCDGMSDAATRSAVAVAVTFEGPLRQAVADTGAAISAWVGGAEPTGVPPPESAASSLGMPRPAAVLGPSASVRVLLADDDPAARRAVSAMLSTADWIDLVGDADGVQAIVELVAAEQPDIVVLDWMMPAGGGAEAARQILAQNPDTLIVAVTSSDSVDGLTEMISAGASCLVSKGGSADQLTQTIARALRASAAPRAPQGERAPERMVALTSAAPDVERTASRADPLDLEQVEILRTEFASSGVLGELVELFGSQTPDRLIQLQEAIDAQDAAAVSSHAHQLKGGCLTLAATRMAGLCGELEEVSRAGSVHGAQALADQIQVAFEHAYAALRREID